jgi:hypothetical protein
VNSSLRILLPTLWLACLVPVITSLVAQDRGKGRVCDHGTHGSSSPVDLDAVEKSLKRAESAIKLSLPSGFQGGELEGKVGTDLPACRASRRVEIRLGSPVPQAAVGSRLAFVGPTEIPDGALPAKTAFVIVGVKSLSEIIRMSTELKAKPEPGVYLASPELLKAFHIECVPATVTFSSRTDAVVEMGSR